MDLKPFIVKYKAGLDRSIKPGIHGKFATHEEALAQARKCQDFFNTSSGPKSAIVGIVTDEKQLLMQQREAEEVDPDVGAKEEMTELELLRAEVKRLRAEKGDDEECEDLLSDESGSIPQRGNTKKSRGSLSTSEG